MPPLRPVEWPLSGAGVKSPLLVKRSIFPYAVLLLLFAVTLLYEVRYTIDIVHGEKVDAPLVVMRSASNEVGFVDGGAVGAGVQLGDRVLAVNGVPYIGSSALFQALARTPVRGQVALKLHRRDDPPAQERVVMLQVKQTEITYSELTGDLVLHFLLPAACLLLGFSLALMRTRDPLAWLLLAVMLSFPQILETYKVQGWPGGWGQAGMLYHAGLAAVFPISMFLFGRFFPEPFSAGSGMERAWRIQQWALVLPFAIVSAGNIVVQIGELGDYPRVAPLDDLLRPFNAIARVLVYWLIGSFFSAMAVKGRMTKSPDAKRRVRIVYWGATVAFSPGLLLSLYSVLRHWSAPADLLPQWAIVLALIPLIIFPLTLTYVIVVHKAMGVSVVIRQGLQYALATNGVRAMRVAAIAALAVATVEVLGNPHYSWVQRMAVLLIGATAVLSLRRLGGWLRVWIDRRFFREAYDAEYILTELSDQVRTIMETKPLLETVACRIAETLHVPQVLVLLQGGNVYQTAFAMGYGGNPEEVFLPSMGTVEVLREQKEPVRVYPNDRESWLYRESRVDPEELRKLTKLQTELLLPLLARDHLLGFISLGPKKSEEPYTGSDLRLLKSVAAQTGLALDNANLVREISAEVAHRERLNREVEIAREVQERLFPQELPQICGLDYAGYCRPALGVGGDYYDFLALRRGQLGVAIGDVSGKGIAAALMMASLQASLRGEVARAPEDLAAMISNVNRLVYEVSSSNRYATFFYGQYDPESHLLQYVNAGHNPPMVFRPEDGAVVARLEAGGTVVGLLPSPLYEQGSIRLAPGDVFVAFTDGISEAMNPEDEEWGEERLTKAVNKCAGPSAEGLMKRLFAEADSFVSGAEQHDDMTLVILRVKE
jgi:phosphoserine phosphatase RsbU/P